MFCRPYKEDEKEVVPMPAILVSDRRRCQLDGEPLVRSG